MPHPQGANEIARVLRRERQAMRGQTARAQALDGLAETRDAERLIEQAFPCPGKRGLIRQQLQETPERALRNSRSRSSEPPPAAAGIARDDRRGLANA
jgi:hypothetical protein